MPTSSTICRLCGSERTGLWKPRNLDRELTPDDFKITDSRYGVTLTLHKCADCSFLFADDAEIRQLTALYEQLEDPAYEDGAENRALQMQWLLEMGRTAHPQARTLLEVGAGSGLLIAEARRLGLDATGVEPSRSLVAAAQRLNGVELLQGTFPHPQLQGRQFDLIYIVDVIEHLDDPVRMLEACSAALSSDGVLVVVTPDVSSLAARILRHRWWHFRLAHVGYFNNRSMREAARKTGLAVQSIRRVQWFFPIHYLAERVAQYLPIRPINRIASNFGPLRRLYDCVIPLNLHDSSAFTMVRKG